MRRTVLVLGLCTLCAGSAVATEDLVSGLSQDTVEITSNYSGTDIVVFGAANVIASLSATSAAGISPAASRTG